MTSQEFSRLFDELTIAMPGLGAWLSSLPEQTSQVWFREVFADLKLDDCRMVVREILRGEHDVEGFKRDRLPRVFVQRCSEIAFNRERREDGHVRVERPRGSRNALGAVVGETFSSGMARSLDDVVEQMRAYRQEHGECMSDELITLAVAKAMAAHDRTPDDDPWDGPRYRCRICQDSGYASYRDDEDRAMAGHCSCERGEAARVNWSRKPRRQCELGSAPRCREMGFSETRS